jgi:hypothetical protein
MQICILPWGSFVFVRVQVASRFPTALMSGQATSTPPSWYVIELTSPQSACFPRVFCAWPAEGLHNTISHNTIHRHVPCRAPHAHTRTYCNEGCTSSRLSVTVISTCVWRASLLHVQVMHSLHLQNHDPAHRHIHTWQMLRAVGHSIPLIYSSSDACIYSYTRIH